MHVSSWELTTHGKVPPHFPLNVDVLLCLTSERLSPSDRLERGERPTARCVANRRPCRIAFHLHEGLAIAVIHFLPPLLRGRGDHIKGHWTLYSVASAIKKDPPPPAASLLRKSLAWSGEGVETYFVQRPGNRCLHVETFTATKKSQPHPPK